MTEQQKKDTGYDKDRKDSNKKTKIIIVTVFPGFKMFLHIIIIIIVTNIIIITIIFIITIKDRKSVV